MKPSVSDIANLRVGDRVVFILAQYPANHPARGPSEVTITKFQQTVEGIVNRKVGCLLSWAPSALTHSPFGWQCNGSDVVSIISRGPLKADRSHTRNVYFLSPDDYTWEGIGLGRNLTISQPIQLAKRIVCKDPTLDIYYGFAEQRLISEWKKSGYPGYVGRYSFTEGDVSQAVEPVSSFLRDIEADVLHTKKFKKWLLRRLPHLVKTKAEFLREQRSDGDRFHKHDGILVV